MAHFGHDHDGDCGHDDETHKRMSKKFEAFMEDVADDLFSEKDLANLYSIITSCLRSNNIPTSLSYLKAFNEGFQFGQYASQNHGSDSIQMIAGMKRIAKLKQEEIKTLAAKAVKMQEEESEEEDKEKDI